MPSTALDYTAWPTVAHVLDRVGAMGPTLAASIDTVQVQSQIDGIVDEVTRTTQRQFLAGKTDSGSPTTTTATTLTDLSKSWTVNQWIGYTVYINSGPGINEQAVIISNTSNTLTVASWSIATPTSASTYTINEVRYFNGSGAGFMQIDEFITLTSVLLFGYLGIPSGLSLSATAPVTISGQPNSRIVIARGSLPAFAPIWIANFPEGRENIAVLAQFGYGLTIPRDLWQAVCDNAAQRLVQFEEYQIEGRIKKWSEENIASEEYDLSGPEDLLQSEERLQKAITRYRRSSTRRSQQSLRML